ncbi:MAG: acyl--CoA ligase, partial [Ardenticatenaceae bacterium]
TRAGAVAAPLNPAYTIDEFKFYMEDANSQLFITSLSDEAGRKAAESLSIPVMIAALSSSGRVEFSKAGTSLTRWVDAEPPSPGDAALLLHTSGTTSRPKAVPLTHGNIMTSIRNISTTYQLTPYDTAMVVMPLFHVHGLIGVSLSTLSTGGTIVVPPRFSAGQFWPLQKETGATWYSAVPTIHQILLARAEDDEAPHTSFRFIRSCSSALARPVFEQLERRFGAPVLEAYGMTEAAHQMASNPLPPSNHYAGTVGRGTGVEIAVMDENWNVVPDGAPAHVMIRGANVTHGYLNNPQANAESFRDGWFSTGDQGHININGYLTLTGRYKELINRGGEKISPNEIDEVLLSHPCVADAVAFAVPDAKYGEAVYATVVLKADSTEEAIRDFCREHIAEFKVPDRIIVTDQIPRAATGKIQRRHLTTMYSGDLKA